MTNGKYCETITVNSNQEIIMDNQNQQQTPKQNRMPIVVILLVLLVAIIIVAVYAFNKIGNRPQQTDNSQTSATEQTINKTAELSTDPSIMTSKSGEVVTFSIWLDTGNQKVSTVEAILNYPVDQYDFVSIDDSESAFSINAEATGQNGIVTIARGQIDGVSGKVLVGKVNLKTKTSSGQGNLTFSDDSKVLTLSDDPQNILNETSGATLQIEN